MDPLLSSILAPGRWPAFVFVSARVSGLAFTAPFWSATAVPHRIRAAMVVALTAALLPAAPAVEPSEHLIALPLQLAVEMMVGIALGLAAAVLVQGFTLAGEVVALQTGLSLGPALAPVPEMPLAGLGQIQGLLGLLVFVCLDGHLTLIRVLADSLRALPPGAPLDVEQGGRAAVACVGLLFSGAVRIAAPVMVALLLTHVALGLLARAVPHLNALLVSFPITIGVGLLVLGASLPSVTHVAAGWMERMPELTARVIDAFLPPAAAR